MSKSWVVFGVGGAVLVIGALGLGYWAGRRAEPSPVVTRAPASPTSRTVPAAPTAPPTSAPAKPLPIISVSSALLATAAQAEEHEQWLAARKTYQQIVHDYPEAPEAMQAQQRLGDINVRLLFSPNPDPNAPFYTNYAVQVGDTLGRIARHYHTTIELLQKANRLTGDKILVGRMLRVPTATFSVVVDKSQNQMTLKANEEVIKTYGVSTGKEDQTPVGTFTIVNKLVDPPWYTSQGVIPPGSPQNILGTRWLGFSKQGYGIHGTTDPATIGQSVTAGCVRMRNQEVEELYALLPLGTEVTIVD